ncbi:MAG TPA: glycosyltransferase [Cyanobacteria bacterium UBA8530]|nr:glycosyltransferase [Cyanobacteria bacterium UBA8530]
MRITLMTLGSRGDVQPFLALAHGLRQAGHTIRIATHAAFEPSVRSFGFGFAPMPGDPREMLKSDLGRDLVDSRNPVRGFHRIMASGILDSILRDAQSALVGQEALIFSTLSFVGFHVAEKLGIPAIAAHLQPMGPTKEFPYLFLPQKPSWGILNRATHFLGDGLAQVFFAPMAKKWRRDLGLPIRGEPIPLNIPSLFGYSPLVVPKPIDWEEGRHVTGYWFLDSPNWQPPRELAAFLEKGPPPVCVGFGSMGSKDPVATTRTVIAALRKTGQRGLLIGGWGGFEEKELPEDFLLLDEAPHDWLFPRVAAVVCHGGAGTTAACLRAGVPAILVPNGMDQPFWGHRLAELGVAPPFVSRKKMNPDRLSIALQAARDPGMIERSRALGERLRGENGVGRAVEAFEKMVGVPVSIEKK